MNGHLPFLLKPAAKDYLWGGNRLKEEYGKKINSYPLAETWECSTLPDGQSIVDSGKDRGKKLGEVLNEHPEYLGTHPLQMMCGKPVLPVLIKLIDAKQKLSVQVHPDDDYALTYENSLGKTEMWYVLSAGTGDSIIYGFKQNMTVQRVREAIKTGNLEGFLNRVPVCKDEVFFIEAGTIHAIGAGVVLAEIQESSNLTYRLYDYDRVDKHGRPRELHIEKALQVMNFRASPVPCQPMRVFHYQSGCARELLARCKYFRVERVLLNTEECQSLAKLKTTNESFRVLLCIDGVGSLFSENFMLHFFKGDCIFVPADSILLSLRGKARLLDVSCC